MICPDRAPFCVNASIAPYCKNCPKTSGLVASAALPDAVEVLRLVDDVRMATDMYGIRNDAERRLR